MRCTPENPLNFILQICICDKQHTITAKSNETLEIVISAPFQYETMTNQRKLKKYNKYYLLETLRHVYFVFIIKKFVRIMMAN